MIEPIKHVFVACGHVGQTARAYAGVHPKDLTHRVIQRHLCHRRWHGCIR